MLQSANLIWDNSNNTLSATNFIGTGTGLTALNASNLTSGTVAISQGGTGTTTSSGTGSNVLNTNPTITGGTFSGTGTGLNALNASNLTSGTLAVSYGGTGTTTSSGTGSVVLNTNPTITGGTFSGP